RSGLGDALKTGSPMDVSRMQVRVLIGAAAVMIVAASVLEPPAAQAPAPQGGGQAPPGRGGAGGGAQPVPGQQGGRAMSPAAQRPPQTATPQSYPVEQVNAGRALFAAQCGFCHGRDAMGG